MGKLKLQIQLSLDGFIAGKNGEMDWMTLNWSEDIINYVSEITEPIKTIVLGKNLAQGFIPHWTEAFKKEIPEPGSEKFIKTPKVVFSKSISTHKWENTEIANGSLIEDINKLKNKIDGVIMAYGGGSFVSSLIQHQLIDEFYLFINPVILGNGMPIFESIINKQNLKLNYCKQFECGIVVLNYQL